ncbi:MAG: EamA family transporter RarD [Spirochaetia bacterium]
MNNQNGTLAGTAYAVGAFTLWGLLPLYWNLLEHVPAFEVLSHRLLWTALSVTLLLVAARRYRVLQLLRDHTVFRRLFLTGMLLGINWFTYIYAINAGRVLDASMGYYINPLVSIFLGMLFLGERLSLFQKVAVGLAGLGVLVITVHYAVIPWVALVLAGTFGFYGLIKKQMGLRPLTALAAESSFLAPLGLAIIVTQALRGEGAFISAGAGTTGLLVVTGVVTALPLYWFAQGATRIPLSRVGFIQYIAPTLMLLIGVLVFGEPFTAAEGVSFGLIWTGLALYSLSHFPRVRVVESRLARRLPARSPDEKVA